MDSSWIGCSTRFTENCQTSYSSWNPSGFYNIWSIWSRFGREENYRFDGKCCKNNEVDLRKYELVKIPFHVITYILEFICIEINHRIRYKSTSTNTRTNNILRELFGIFILDKFCQKPHLLFSSIFICEPSIRRDLLLGTRPTNLRSLIIENFGYSNGFDRFSRYPYLRTLKFRNLKNRFDFFLILEDVNLSYPNLENLDFNTVINATLLKRASTEVIEFPNKLKILSLSIDAEILLSRPRKRTFRFPSELEELNIRFATRTNGFDVIKKTRIFIQQLFNHECFQEIDCVHLKKMSVYFYVFRGSEYPSEQRPIEFHHIKSNTFHFVHQKLNCLERVCVKSDLAMSQYVVITGEDLLNLYGMKSLNRIQFSNVHYDKNTFGIHQKHAHLRIPARKPLLDICFENIKFTEHFSLGPLTAPLILSDRFYLPHEFRELIWRKIVTNSSSKTTSIQCFPRVEILNLTDCHLSSNFLDAIPSTTKYVFLKGCVIGSKYFKFREEDINNEEVLSAGERICVFKLLSFDHCRMYDDVWENYFPDLSHHFQVYNPFFVDEDSSRSETPDRMIKTKRIFIVDAKSDYRENKNTGSSKNGRTELIFKHLIVRKRKKIPSASVINFSIGVRRIGAYDRFRRGVSMVGVVYPNTFDEEKKRDKKIRKKEKKYKRKMMKRDRKFSRYNNKRQKRFRMKKKDRRRYKY